VRALIPFSRVFIAVTFPHSKGERYPSALELARNADFYREGTLGAGPLHIAGFHFERSAILRAVALLEYAGCIRGCMVLNPTSVWGPERTLRVLRCILTALGCRNPAAYCRIPCETPANVPPGSAPSILPCRLLDCYFIKNWHSTEPIPDQLQAAAVESGCEWCPLFNSVEYYSTDRCLPFPQDLPAVL